VAGWGRSEVDGVVSVLRYHDCVIHDCVLLGSGTAESWSPIVVERADGVDLRDLRVGRAPAGAGTCCRRAVKA
jgi:hypothetical protein